MKNHTAVILSTLTGSTAMALLAQAQKYPSLVKVFETLLALSLDNHLEAFDRASTRGGVIAVARMSGGFSPAVRRVSQSAWTAWMPPRRTDGVVSPRR